VAQQAVLGRLRSLLVCSVLCTYGTERNTWCVVERLINNGMQRLLWSVMKRTARSSSSGGGLQ
jgi:hypothetical protein